MKLTVLGCWAPYPAPNQACSGYLLECGHRKILIDIGHGAFAKLQQVCDFSMLDAVFVSHLHADHCADLSCLRHAVLGARRLGKKISLPVYMPCEPQGKFEVLANFEDAFEVHTIAVDSQAPLDVAGLKCRIFRAAHPIPTYGLAVEEDGKKFVYTSDTAWEDKLVEFSRDADILLSEASLLEADHQFADKGHLTSGQAGLLASKAGARRLIITHFWPGYAVEDLTEEASAAFKGLVEPAVEFKKYTHP